MNENKDTTPFDTYSIIIQNIFLYNIEVHYHDLKSTMAKNKK